MARTRDVRAATLVSAGPFLFIAARAIRSSAEVHQVGSAWLGLGAGIAMAAAGLLWHWRHRVAVVVATLGLALFVAAAIPALLHRPALAFVCGAGVLGLGFWIWAGRPGALARAPEALQAVRISAALALGAWGLTTGGRLDLSWQGRLAAAISAAIAVACLLRWLRVARVRLPVWGLLLIALVPVAALGQLSLGHVDGALSVLVTVPAATLLLARERGRGPRGLAALVLFHPARLVVVTFFVLCAIGTALVVLPVCSETGTSIGLLDGAFTAVSAVCVTGLIVVDTPNAFSATGEAVILVLIQLGALGIMSLSAAAIGLLGRRPSLRQESAMAGAFGAEHRGQLYGVLRRTLAVTFAMETVGAVLLVLLFWHAGDGIGVAAWRGLFTAVSAFCNAGFALQSDSLIPYHDHPAILNVVAMLIIAGGLSPFVIASAPLFWRHRPAPLQVKIILLASVVFLAVGFLGYLAMEWNHSLAGLSLLDRLDNAWFQSVTLRTAGFNSVDLGDVHAATLPLMVTLMFIGGAPAGTAGGIKVTTAWILLLAVLGTLRGRSQARAFERRVPHRTVYEAVAIVMIGLVLVVVMLVAMFLTQDMGARMAAFEVVSAVGTVGLSLGGTEFLDGVGKVIIIATMFLGRVGPLTAFLFLSERHAPQRLEYPEERVEVG